MKAFKIMAVLMTATLFSLLGAATLNMTLGISPVVSGLGIFVASFIPTPKGALCINIFTAPGGVATPFSWNMLYLPQFISFDNTVPLTSLRIETAEDGILHDWTAAGMVAMANFMHVGAQGANILQLRVADGQIGPKNVTISGVTSAAGAVKFFVNSDNPGRLAFRSKNAQILANNPTTFTRFSALFIPAMATATDRIEVTFINGQQQTYAKEDLVNLSAIYQQVAGVILNNTNAYIDHAIVTCAAATPAYVMSVNIPGQV